VVAESRQMYENATFSDGHIDILSLEQRTAYHR
jgi:hypothetical protein